MRRFVVSSAFSVRSAGCASLRYKSAPITPAQQAPVPSAGSPTIPSLGFLCDKTCLLETVDGTIESCEKLLNAITQAKTPQEKHDLIDTTSNVLCLLLDPCEFVRQIHEDHEYKHFASLAFQKGHEYMCEVNGRRKLFDVILELSSPEAQKGLTEESIKNVAQLRRDMESNGIHLDDAQRNKVTKMNIEKEDLATQFITDKSANPFGVLRNLIVCRYNLSKLLGFESFAEQQLRGTMIETPQRVWHFLCGIDHKYRSRCDPEVELLKKNIGEVKARGALTDDSRSRVTVALRRAVEPERSHEYFSVANCVRGIQLLCEETFGVLLKQVPFEEDEFLCRDAKKFLVYDMERNNEFLGVIVVDMFARTTKMCQAGHMTVQLGCRPSQKAAKIGGIDLPERQYPIVVLTCNAGSEVRATKRDDGTFDDELTLMLPHEVTTCFHEFGHALHTIFGQTTVQNLAGTRGSIDYVEIFSQLFEHFLKSHDFLKRWAFRRATREPISFDLVQKRNDAVLLFKNLDTIDQVLLSAVDQTLHGPQPFTVYFPHGPNGHLGKRTLGELGEYGRGMYNLAKLICDVCEPLTPIKPTETGVLRTLSFEHLSSYPAAYYGYLYSNAIATRIWDKKFKHEPLNRKAGRELVDMVLRHGAACNPADVLSKYLQDDLDEIDLWV
jgi:intermediate peptidase